MKNIPLDTIKSFLSDREFVVPVVILGLLMIAYIVYVALALEPSDLQVATRYTAFGDTHFYRNKWYYLLSFILFTIVMIGLHVSLAVKLYGRGQRQPAMALLYLTFMTLGISWIMTESVLKIAFL